LPPTHRCLIFFDVKKNVRPDIPRKTIYRLSIYLRCLARLRENSIGTVSSEALAKAAGVKPTQLRKDLAYFGTFGTRGLGYDVADLSQKISDELGTSSLQPVVVVGVGNLGLALLSVWPCFPIVVLNGKGLKSSRRLTLRPSANATRKSSSPSWEWMNWGNSSMKKA
jgi:hypothetical protein